MCKFVLSVEGPNYVDRSTCGTHKILGVFESQYDAVAALAAIDTVDKITEEDVVLLTDMQTGTVERIERSVS